MFSWKRDEVLVTIGIMLTILVISLVQLRDSQMKTRDAQRKADAGIISRALAAYWADHLTLPGEKDGKIVGCGGKGVDVCEWGAGQIQDAEGIVYLKKMPIDPLADKGRTYMYERDEAGKKFRIYVAVEYRRDPEVKSNLTIGCGKNVQCNWYAEN